MESYIYGSYSISDIHYGIVIVVQNTYSDSTGTERIWNEQNHLSFKVEKLIKLFVWCSGDTLSF